MSDFVDRDLVVNALSTITMYKGGISFDTAMYKINVLPSADVITRDEYAKVVLERDNALTKLKDTGSVTRVTRCRDCRYWRNDPEYGLHFCTYVIGARFARRDDDFCSRGDAKR